MYDEVVVVSVVSALLGLIAGLLMRPATEMARVLGARGLAMLRGKGKRGQDKTRKKRVAKVKAAKEPAASRRQPKAKPIELAAPVALADSAKPKKKVGRPSKAELARRAQEAVMSGTANTPLTTKQTATEHTVPSPVVTSGQLQELAVYTVAESFPSQTDTLENASST